MLVEFSILELLRLKTAYVGCAPVPWGEPPHPLHPVAKSPSGPTVPFSELDSTSRLLSEVSQPLVQHPVPWHAVVAPTHHQLPTNSSAELGTGWLSLPVGRCSHFSSAPGAIV